MSAPSRHWPTLALAAGLGIVGGLIALIVGLPLPWLLGSLAATAAAGIAGFMPFGRPVALPENLRLVFVPVIGVSIGAAVTPELAGALKSWLPSLLALLLYIPAAHALAFAMARRLAQIDPATAFYGTMPGGFIEAISMGDKAGADGALLSTMQFLRLILCIAGIPIGFTLLTGETVGSATGQVLGNVPLSATDWVVLTASGAVGAISGRRLGLPAGIITGPILMSGAVHLVGWVEGGPPRWLIDVTQLVIGTSLGGRFAGRNPAALLRAAGITLVTVTATLCLAASVALLLDGWVGESWQAVFLAFAPGGLAEMSLVALSLEISVIYVTAHHILRIILSVVFAKAGARWVLGAR
ncbi:MAG: AbrB family transcriptional regulator [Pseudomonadota bacterium]